MLTDSGPSPAVRVKVGRGVAEVPSHPRGHTWATGQSRHSPDLLQGPFPGRSEPSEWAPQGPPIPLQASRGNPQH